MAIDINETMTKIGQSNPVEGEELVGLFDEVRTEWLSALDTERDTLVWSSLMREVGKRFPIDDPRNPDSTVYTKTS